MSWFHDFGIDTDKWLVHSCCSPKAGCMKKLIGGIRSFLNQRHHGLEMKVADLIEKQLFKCVPDKKFDAILFSLN